MCGIAGSLRLNPSHLPLDEESTRRALSKIKYRGPDFSNTICAGSVVLGQNRLKILDLSDNGNQPMSDSTERYFIVFNGEIFNYRELKKNLLASGVSLITESDTEVLLHLLIQKGQSALNELNGFFALAFYDKVENKLLLARDRFGEKPLWYHQNEQSLFFASELKALREYKIPNEIDPVSLSLFLQFSYVPGPGSILKEVYKLEPGHCISVVEGKFEKSKWYDPQTSQDKFNSKENAKKQFKEILEDSVRLRMHADVPVGCFLSGGADSSVVALLASQQTTDLQTFSMGFPDRPFLDETPYALDVAKHIKSKHEVIQINSNQLLDEINEVWNFMDEPFADSSGIAVSLLSRRVKQCVTVALSGDGADEILGGYNKYLALLSSTRPDVKNTIIPFLNPLIDVLPEGRDGYFNNRFRQLKKYSRILNQDLKSRYITLSSWSDESLCESLMTQQLAVRRGARLNQFVQNIRSSDFNSILIADQQLVLSNDMLTKVDSMSMMHALEVRPPFLDHRLVEFVNALPLDYKIHNGKRKVILEESFHTELPSHVFSRNKKGFEVPLEKWLRNELRPAVESHIAGNNLTSCDYLKKNVVQEILHEFYSRGKNKNTWLIYAILVFEVWFRQFNNSQTK